MCDEIIEEAKTILTSCNEKAKCKTQNFNILLEFLLIIFALLIAASL